MEEVFINVKGLTIEDLFKKDVVSVDDLVAKLEEQMYDIEELEEELKERPQFYEMEER